MKLLYILKSFEKGGVSTVLTNRLNFLAEHTMFEIHVLTECPSDKKLLSMVNPKVKFHVLDSNDILARKRFPLVGFYLNKMALHKKYKVFIENISPHIITDFDWGYYRDIIPTIDVRAIKIKELHGSYVSRPLLANKKGIVTRFIDRNIFKNHNCYDLVVTLTKEDLQDRAYLKTNATNIYNPIKGVEIKKTNFNERQKICLSVGTLTANKNFRDLIIAVNEIKDKRSGWEFHIYGEGKQRKELQELIDHLQLGEIVKLKGFCYDMANVYNAAKLLVSTSVSEGLPMNFLEALSYDIPVISYDFKCGAKEIIGNTNGSLIRLKDINALSKKILEFISNEELLLRTSNQIDISKFENEKIMQQWIKLYTDLYKDNAN